MTTTHNPGDQRPEVDPRFLDSNGYNLRYQLRAFENANSCRTASILINNTDICTRRDLRLQWRIEYPHHARETGKGRIPRKIMSALHLLKIIGAVACDGDQITRLDPALLRLVASNLAIVQDGRGQDRTVAQWPRWPHCPPRLAAIQRIVMEENL